jgi:hypothetical protein
LVKHTVSIRFQHEVIYVPTLNGKLHGAHLKRKLGEAEARTAVKLCANLSVKRVKLEVKIARKICVVLLL